MFISSLSPSSGLSITDMQEQNERLTGQADATVTEQLTAEAEAEALRRALGNITSSLRQFAPTGSSPSPEQTNQTGSTNETTEVSPRRRCGAQMGFGALLRSVKGTFIRIHVRMIQAQMRKKYMNKACENRYGPFC